MKITLIKLLGIILVPALSGCTSVQYNVLTGKESLTFISEEQEVKLGRKISEQLKQEYEIIMDPRIRDIVKDVGYNLVKSCDRKTIVYYFDVIRKKEDYDKDEPNAFALPGGYVYINKQLLDLIGLDNRDEIAAVLAHELSHLVLRHNILKLQEAIGTQMLMIILTTSAPDNRTIRNSNLALVLLMLAYSKEREIEADRLALRYMKSAGYDPEAMIRVFKKLQDYQFQSPIRKYYLKTHPYMSERIELINRELSLIEAIQM